MMNPEIRVIPIRKAGAFDHWEMSLDNGTPQGPGHYPTAHVTKGDQAHFTVTIVNPQGIGFTPVGSTSGPIFIQPGSAKPTGGIDAQITDVTVKDNGSDKGAMLTFTDTNKKKGDLTYVLNFQGAPQLDPIVDNGGPGLKSQLVWYAVGAIAVAALLYLLLKPMLVRRRVSPADRPTDEI
jgi:hypothetical protein